VPFTRRRPGAEAPGRKGVTQVKDARLRPARKWPSVDAQSSYSASAASAIASRPRLTRASCSACSACSAIRAR